jgi:hypothetical protein
MPGLIEVLSNDQLDARERERAARDDAFAQAQQDWSEQFSDQIAAHVRRRHEEFDRHWTSTGLRERMLAAMRTYNGQYTPEELAAFKQMGGSDVYARLAAIKCRGASAMLRDVYLSGDRPWSASPTPVPALPEDIVERVNMLVDMEVESMVSAGQEVPPEAVEQRRDSLLQEARSAAKRKAKKAAAALGDQIEDILREGGFYRSLAEFITDLPIFPLAIVKGPEVRRKRIVVWEDGLPIVRNTPMMTWQRVSPFDIRWTPGAKSIEEADVIERIKLRRSDLQALLGVHGYDDEAIRGALTDYTHGHYHFYEPGESERANLEDRESPGMNYSDMIDSLLFQGEIQGELLRAWNNGEVARKIKDFDPALDYAVSAWIAGRHTIKVHVQPNPLRRHNYFATSFETMPGSVAGHGLPEVLSDTQHVANSAFRALVNNMSISSGPQVVVNEDRVSPSTNPDSIYPWKRWRFLSDPHGVAERPIDFFQPSSNAAELIGVFDKMMALSDEVSGIPRYLTGNQNVGGAASTASGLGMLMNNASKVLQQVASQIDTHVIQPLLDHMTFIAMLADESGASWGDAQIVVRGVTMAMAKEADRQRQLEFLQLTANPLDFQIMGPTGRAKILRSLDDNLGLGEDVVPDDETIEAAAKQQMMVEQAAAAQGGQAPAPGPSDSRPNRDLDNAQRTRSPQAIQRQATP